jgi:hypothetical protein
MSVTNERGKAYGKPKVNHTRTARLWTAFLHNKGLGSSFHIEAEDVCLLNILQKVARTQHGAQHLDNLTDIAGYADNLEEIWNGSKT